MKRLLSGIVVGLIATALFAVSANAHSGRTNADGCHHAGSNSYHCHEAQGSSSVPMPTVTPTPPNTGNPERPNLANFTFKGRSVNLWYSEIAWPNTCVEMNDWIEFVSGLVSKSSADQARHFGNIGIYERVFGDNAEQACRNDHRGDVRRAFAWAF